LTGLLSREPCRVTDATQTRCRACGT